MHSVCQLMNGVFLFAGPLKDRQPPCEALYMLDLKLMKSPGAFFHMPEKFVAHFFHDSLPNHRRALFYNNSAW
jgi:hypothetical protein